MKTMEEKAKTIILPGIPHLEWMTENLTGHGGTEIDGCWYYTYEQAEEAVKQLGDGWRLPTRGEMLDLDDLGSTWDDERKGRWFGGNHATDHEGSLFLEAAGYRLHCDGSLDGCRHVGRLLLVLVVRCGQYPRGSLGIRLGRGSSAEYRGPCGCALRALRPESSVNETNE